MQLCSEEGVNSVSNIIRGTKIYSTLKLILTESSLKQLKLEPLHSLFSDESERRASTFINDIQWISTDKQSCCLNSSCIIRTYINLTLTLSNKKLNIYFVLLFILEASEGYKKNLPVLWDLNNGLSYTLLFSC